MAIKQGRALVASNSVVKTKEPSAEAVLQSFIANLNPKIQKLFKSVRTAVRKRFPAANELAYDYGTHVVISYSPTEAGAEGILAIAGRSDGVQLYLTQGKQLPDPKKLLQGSANARYIWLESAAKLAHADVKSLIDAALKISKKAFPSKGEGKLIIRPTAAAKRRK